MSIRVEWLPRRCAYCDEPVACVVRKINFPRITRVMVCEYCAHDIWLEETDKRGRLP